MKFKRSWLRTSFYFITLASVLALLAGWMASPDVAVSDVQPGTASAAQQPSSAISDPTLSVLDRSVADIVRSVADRDIRAAIQKADALIETHPHFRLGHLLRADLYRLLAGEHSLLASGGALPNELQGLRVEFERRWQAVHSRPASGTVPRGLWRLNPTSPYAIAVDASLSRAYVLKSQDGGKNVAIVRDFFISVGKAGVGKEVEGDNKTPLGVYRIVGKRSASQLPAFYGAGALILDYPHAADRQRGRTGYGIWIHGSPPEEMVRPPESSEGCVVASNEDMDFLMAQNDIIGAPVLIAKRLQWVTSMEAQKQVHRLESELRRYWREQHIDVGSVPFGLQEWTESDGQRYVVASGQHDNAVLWSVFMRRQLDHWAWAARPSSTFTTQFAVAPALPAASASRQVAVEASPTAGSNATSRTTVTNAAADGRFNGERSAQPAATIREVEAAVRAWARAWESRQTSRYLAFYHPHFRPPAGMSRVQWQRERKARIEPRRHIEVRLDRLRISVNGDNAQATFLQTYRADGGQTLRTSKTLVLRRYGGQWRIVEEETGRQ